MVFRLSYEDVMFDDALYPRVKNLKKCFTLLRKLDLGLKLIPTTNF